MIWKVWYYDDNNNEVIINIISDSMDDAIMCARFFDPRYCFAQVVDDNA